jgi:hypothetical protein
MERYFKALLDGYYGYASYLIDEILHPKLAQLLLRLGGCISLDLGTGNPVSLAQKPAADPGAFLAGHLLCLLELLSVCTRGL